jgi:hypothetical protein
MSETSGRIKTLVLRAKYIRKSQATDAKSIESLAILANQIPQRLPQVGEPSSKKSKLPLAPKLKELLFTILSMGLNLLLNLFCTLVQFC